MFVVVRVGRVRVRGVAAERALLRAVAGRARDRVLVFAGQAVHDLDAAVSRPGDGSRAGRRLAGGRRPRRLGAVAARAGDRRVGRRIRRALRVPGPRFRSRARAAIDSGAVRRAGVAGHFARACTSLTVVCLLALAVGHAAAAGSTSRAWPSSRVLLVYEQSLVRADDLSQVKRAFDLNGYVGILYLLVLARVDLWPLSAPHRSRSRSPARAARSTRCGRWPRCWRRASTSNWSISDYGRRLLRDELGDEATVERLLPYLVERYGDGVDARHDRRCTATAISARRSPAAATAAAAWRSCPAR